MMMMIMMMMTGDISVDMRMMQWYEE